jgi:hypothetical protein
MKKTLFLTLFLLIIFRLYSQSEQQFIKYKWGSTMDLIIMNEGIPNNKYEDEIFSQDCHGIIYSNKNVAKYPTHISYEFFNNKLHMVNYDIFVIDTIQEWIKTYFYLRDALKNIYGDYYLSHGIPDEKDDQMMERIMLLFSSLREKDDYLYDKNIFHRIVWHYFDTVIEMELYINGINNFKISILFTSSDFYKNRNELLGSAECLTPNLPGVVKINATLLVAYPLISLLFPSLFPL